MLQTDQSALHMANSATSVEKETIYLAAKCTGGRQSSRNLHANQNLNYLQEDSDGSQFEEYTIDVITYQVSAFEERNTQNSCLHQSK